MKSGEGEVAFFSAKPGIEPYPPDCSGHKVRGLHQITPLHHNTFKLELTKV